MHYDAAQDKKCEPECYEDAEAACNRGVCLCINSLTERTGPCQVPATAGENQHCTGGVREGSRRGLQGLQGMAAQNVVSGAEARG